MLEKLWTIAWLQLKITYNDRATFIFGFALPVLFTFIIGQAIGGFDDGDGPPSWPLAVVDEDGSELATTLVTRLEAEQVLAITVMAREAALTTLDEGDVVAVMVIPAGFETAVLTQETAVVDYYANPEAVQVGQVVQEVVNLALARLEGVFNSANTAVTVSRNLGIVVDETALLAAAEMAWESPPILVAETQVTRLEEGADEIPQGLSQSSPGIMVMFAMFFTLAGTAVLVQEREEGTLRRLVVMPIDKGLIIGGKLLGVYVAGVAQITILVVAGALLFGVNWGQSPVAIALMILSFAFAITSLGMLVAALVRTLAQANNLPTVIVLPMAALGGAMWPIEITPQWMQQIGHLFPTAWAMDGFHDVVTRGLGVTAVLPEVFILIGYGILFLLIGIWRFRYE